MTKGVCEKDDEITLKPAQLSDMAVLLEWRNHPDVRKSFFDSAQLTVQGHEAWFKRKIEDPDTVIYMAYLGGEKIGSIRFEDDGDVRKVSVMLNPAFLGRGLGTRLLSGGVAQLTL